MGRNVLVDFSNHALQRLARTALRKVGGTILNHVLYNLRPAHRAGQLGYQVLLDFGSIRMRLGVYILINGALRGLELRILNGSLLLVLGRLHQRRVESTTHLQRQRTLGTGSLQLLASLVHSVNVTADNQLTRIIVVGRHHNTLAQL